MNQNQKQNKKQAGDDESQQNQPILPVKRNARQAKIAVGDNAA